MGAELQVAVGVVLVADRVLISKRQQHQDLAGLWEFPGGKIEANESPAQALVRELTEEVGLNFLPQQCEPLLNLNYQYPNKTVCLNVFYLQATEQSLSQAQGAEGQVIAWPTLAELEQYTFPAANTDIIQALKALPWLQS